MKTIIFLWKSLRSGHLSVGGLGGVLQGGKEGARSKEVLGGLGRSCEALGRLGTLGGPGRSKEAF